MREILFRGKGKDGHWFYGGVAFLPDKDDYAPFITSTEFFEGKEEDEHINTLEIYPHTLGQFTGLKDKNGKHVFEGDVCMIKFAGIPLMVRIAYNSHVACFQIEYPQMRTTIGNPMNFVSDHLHRYAFDIEVIGNIYDNPTSFND